MKKIFLYSSLALMAIGLASCNDFLDENRYPLDSQVDSPDLWNNEANLETMCNTFYNRFDGYGNSSWYGTDSGPFYYQTLSDDQADRSFANWKFTNVPSTSTSWSSPYTEIRRANYIINNVRESTLAESTRKYYEGIARLMRAQQCFLLVKRYGNCQWINEVVDPADDEMVYAPRDDRDMVMDSILADLNYACATIGSGTKITWSSDMANAMKSDICLWEGTYCKYRTVSENGKAADESRAQKYLNECVTASQNVMNGGYTLNDDYRQVYISESLSGNSEAIFYKQYKQGDFRHSIMAYTCSSTQINGITKDAFEAYLFKDGKPKGLTSYDDTDVAQISLELESNGRPITSVYSIQSLLDVRDNRLSEITDSAIYFVSKTWVRAGANNMTSSTGYGVRKFDNEDLDVYYRVTTNQGYTDAPIYWLPVIYCNYAEAKAELGTITQSDLDNTINKLYARAGLPDLSVGAFHDPKNDRGVSDIIWEVRRCRRCELIMDNDFRYWDLIRWHMLDKLDSSKNPDILLGANVSEYPAYVEAFNAAANAFNATASAEDQVSLISMDVPTVGDYIDGSNGMTRTYESKHYFYPVPADEITLNPSLTQNPGW